MHSVERSAQNSMKQKHIAKMISDNKTINCKFFVPNAANDLDIDLQLSKSSFSIGMEIWAPSDKKTNSGFTLDAISVGLLVFIASRTPCLKLS